MKDINTKEKFIELRAKGYSYPRISELIGVSERLLVEWNKEFKEDISRKHLQELEILRDKYQLYSGYRIQTFGNLLLALRKELEQRDFTTVKTEKLIDLEMKLYNDLEKELSPIAKLDEELLTPTVITAELMRELNNRCKREEALRKNHEGD
ncbi:MAG: hypothetical protein APR63_14490 [Desulfuromonas sp. SDB]|nr:MAG: hypothetical protein APR63_14490 [Desulfuromonas sp. SDB]